MYDVDYREHSRHGCDNGFVVTSTSDPVTDALLGGAISVSAFLHRKWRPYVDVVVATPGEESRTITLIADDAIRLATQLVAVAQEVRGSEESTRLLLEISRRQPH